MERYLPDKRVKVNAFVTQGGSNPTLFDKENIPSIEVAGLRPQRAKRHLPRRRTLPVVEINPEDHVIPFTNHQTELIDDAGLTALPLEVSPVERIYII